MLAFLDDQDLDEAHAKVLLELGRVLDAADFYAKKGRMLRAVETLAVSAARSVGRERRMIEYLLAGLRRGFTFGTPPSFIGATISRLLVLADQLDKSAMTEQETHEVSSSHSFSRQTPYLRAPSSQCFKQSDALTVQPFARSLTLSLTRGTTLPLCCAWTMSFRPRPVCNTFRSDRSGKRTPFSWTIFAN